MNRGKLVWRRTPRGAWLADAHDNEDRMYVIRPAQDGWWWATARYRFSHELQELDLHRYLRDAKRAADRHHHARILESDDEDLKAYIERYPIPS